MHKKNNALFVCSRNKWRSKTAETIFKNAKEWNVLSAGTSKIAERKISSKLINWADKIFVMEKKHKEILELKFGRIDKEILVLNIPDDFQYMDEELIRELSETINIK